MLMLFIAFKILYRLPISTYNIPKTFAIYALYVMVSATLVATLNSDVEINSQADASTIRGLKVVFYTACIYIFSNNIDYGTFKKWSYIIACIVSIFILFQYFCFFNSGTVVLGQIPGFSILLEDYTELDYEEIYEYNFRPCSLFLEPAMLSQYMVVPLTLVLFDSQSDNKIKLLLGALFTTCILLSTSAQGVLYLAVIFLLYAIIVLKQKANVILFLICLYLIGMLSYANIEAVQFAIDRLLTGEEAQNARLGSYDYCIQLKSTRMLFGNGYGTTPNSIFLAGAAYVWFGAGLVGLCIALSIFIYLHRNSTHKISRVINLLFFIMLWGTGIFYNYLYFWFFTIIIGISHYANKMRTT